MIGNAFFTILQLCKIKQHQRLKRIQYCNRETLRVSNTRLPPFYYKSVRIIHLKSSTFLKRLYNLYTDQFPHCSLPVSTAFSESFSDLLYASSSSLDILTPIRTMSPPVSWRITWTVQVYAGQFDYRPWKDTFLCVILYLPDFQIHIRHLYFLN